MSLKMKSFKKSIFSSDLRRFWSFALLYGIIIFFGTFFDFYINRRVNGFGISFTASRFFAGSILANLIGIAAGASLAIRLYNFLFSVSALSFYHGLPFKRKSIFISKLCSGFVLLTAPVLINFAIVSLTQLCGANLQIRYIHLLYWLGNQLIYSFLAFACVTFAIMLSGNMFALLVTCLLFAISPAFITAFITTVCQNYLLGYAYAPMSYLQYFYITPDVLLFDARGLIYVAAIPILLLASYFMYKKRDLERCGEAVVFPKLKTLFVYFAGLLGGIFSYFYFSIWQLTSLAFMLPFGIVAVIIANMINRRGITLKGALKHTLIFTVSVLCLLCAFRYDITGFEKRIPALDNIESVTVFADRYSIYFLNNGSDSSAATGKYDITDKDDIKMITEYHRHNTTAEKNTDEPHNIEISYKLKNGRSLVRNYNVNLILEKEYFENIAALRQVKMALYPVYKNEDIKIVSIDLYNSLNSELFYPDNPIFDKLVAAMNEDIENLSYEENAAFSQNSMNFDAPLYVDIEYKDQKHNQNGNYYGNSFYFPISYGFTKTLELLKEYGYYDAFMTVQNITSVGIDKYDTDDGKYVLGDYKVDEVIDEPEKMQEILDDLLSGYKNPVWWHEGIEDSYDEYIFLDKNGVTHTFTTLKR